MYNVSNKYKEAIQKSNSSYLTGTITFKDGSSREISTSDISLGRASITMQSVTQDILEFGSAILGELEISIRVDKSESRYKYYDALIDLIFTIDLDDGTQESIPLGKWTIVEAEREGVALKISAYDNLIKLDKEYALTITGTPYELMYAITEDCKCELAENEDFYKSLPNGEEVITIGAGSACSTYRQVASIVAQMCGAFIQADRYGKISIRQFKTTETFSLTASQRYKSVIADYVCSYVALSVTGLAGTFKSVIDEDATGLTMNIEDAPAWDTGLKEVLQARADRLRAYLDNIRYTPGEILIFGDPSVDCGDYVTIISHDNSINTLVTSYTWKFHGQMELHSVGKNPYLTNTSASKQRILRNLEQNGGGGGSSILYMFKNISYFKCKPTFQSLAQITFVAAKDTFAIFNATVQVDVEIDDVTHTSSISILDSNGNSKTYEVPYKQPGTVDLIIQYYYNSQYIENPYTATLGNGSHIITLHYPFANVKKDSINRFEIHMACNDENVSIQREMFIGTITGAGLAESPKWDGTIAFAEEINTIPVGELDIVDFDEQVRLDKFTVKSSSILENLEYTPIESLPLLDINDSISFSAIVTNHTIDTDNANNYIYDNDYIVSDDGFRLKTEYQYNSAEEEIDTGRMCRVSIRTDDKSNVESVVIV